MDQPTQNNPSHSHRPCPICLELAPYWERYPQAVCSNCRAKACDDRGRKLLFFNVSLDGGFGAIVEENQEPHTSHICYINGIPCHADEARFGGIVIERIQRN